MALKKNGLLIALLMLSAVTVLAACKSSSPSPTATSGPEPTPTPAPVQSINIDPQTDPAGFLAALPSSEVDCAASAVGGMERLEQLVSLSDDNRDGIGNTQLSVLASCVSNDTVQKVVIGQLDIATGGLSVETASCITQHTDGIDFASLFSGRAVGDDTVISTLQALFCLSPGERRALEASDQEVIGVAELGGIDALECAIDGAGPNGLAEFANVFGADGTVDPLAVGRFMPLMIDCGVVDEESLQSTGISSEQFSCLFERLDPETLAKLLTISEDPNATPDLTSAATMLAAMSECGLDLQGIMDSAGSAGLDPNGAPALSTDLLLCLTENGVSASVAANYAAGLADGSDPQIAAALAVCEDGSSSGNDNEGSIVIPDGNGGSTTIDPAIFESLPITAEQAQCLIDQVGVDQLEGVAAGTVSPLAVLGAINACNITIADLISPQG